MRILLHRPLIALSCGILATCAAANDEKMIDPKKALDHVDQTVQVEFVVRSTFFSERSGTTFLHSHKNYRDTENLQIVIFEKDRKAFADAKIDKPHEHYAGKTIRVRGKIVKYQDRPEIIVNQPSAITIVPHPKPAAATPKDKKSSAPN